MKTLTMLLSLLSAVSLQAESFKPSLHWITCESICTSFPRPTLTKLQFEVISETSDQVVSKALVKEQVSAAQLQVTSLLYVLKTYSKTHKTSDYQISIKLYNQDQNPSFMMDNINMEKQVWDDLKGLSVQGEPLALGEQLLIPQLKFF